VEEEARSNAVEDFALPRRGWRQPVRTSAATRVNPDRGCLIPCQGRIRCDAEEARKTAAATATAPNPTAESSKTAAKASAPQGHQLDAGKVKGKDRANDERVGEVSSDMEQLDIEATEIEKPDITAVVVTKRHYTRFFPPNSYPDWKNCEPGTCVDSVVTHPVYFDFFLQSHIPIQGAAKPTYYFVIRNDMNFTATQIQTLTHDVCYTFVRCTLPVGYVPPVYYADQLCERARLYIRREMVDISGRAGIMPQPQPQPRPQRDNDALRSPRRDRFNHDMQI